MALLAGLMLMSAAIQPAAPAPTPAPARALTEGPVDPERLAAAQAFLASLDPERTLRRTNEVMARTTVQQVKPELERQLGRTITADQVARLEAAMRDDMNNLYQGVWPDMMRAMAEAYARVFTAAELRRITELMRDPVMRRMMDTMPEVMQRTFSQVDIVSQMPRMTRMQAVMTELFPHGNGSTTPQP